MEEASLLLTCAILLTVGLWLWRTGAARREPGCWLAPWLYLLSLAGVFDALSQAVGGGVAGATAFSSSLLMELGASYLLLLFSRSFSRPTDFRAFFWSVPMQFAAALVLGGGEAILYRERGPWSLELGEPAALVVLATTALYTVLMLAFMLGLFGSLREEGRKSARVATLTLAFLLVFAGGAVRNALAGYLPPAIYAGATLKLVGAFLLVASLKGAAGRRVDEALETRR
ncbi:MAG: hypothetical protein WHT46_00615 [Candidatus Geothermincolales bacterium]